jgi:hypothetical protein
MLACCSSRKLHGGAGRISLPSPPELCGTSWWIMLAPGTPRSGEESSTRSHWTTLSFASPTNYDRSSDGSVNKDAAVQLCSEKTCKASGLDPAKSVYLRTPRPQDAFQVHKDQLRFHNHSDKKCDIDNSKEGYCDHVVMVGIIQNNGTTVLPEVQYTCGGWLSSGRCKVGFP